MATSKTDTLEFTAACAEAAEDPSKPFRRDRRITRVLEHITEQQGAAYLEVVAAQTPEFAVYKDVFARNDLLGSPVVYDYGDFGNLSPNTCRYLKVLSDLVVMFPDIIQATELDVVEIGGGYGGQARIIACWFRLSSYTIIDLPEALRLQRSYLQDLCPDLPVVYRRHDECEDFVGANLAISNYAISECRRPYARRYVETVLNKCDDGYLTGNYVNSSCPTMGDFLAWLDKDCQIDVEKPKTAARNYLLTWRSDPEGRSDAAVRDVSAR